MFNVLGFSQQHDDNFLNLLSLIGTSDGSYNFVSPSEGDSALHEILVGMVSNFSTSIGRLMNLEVTNIFKNWFERSNIEKLERSHFGHIWIRYNFIFNLTKYEQFNTSGQKPEHWVSGQMVQRELKGGDFSRPHDKTLRRHDTHFNSQICSDARRPGMFRFFIFII